MRRFLVGILLLLCLAGCASTPTGSGASSLRFAFVRKGDLWLWEKGKERPLAPGPDIRHPRFSYDGRFLTFYRGRESLVMGVDGGGPWEIPATSQWSPTANLLAVAQPEGTFLIPVSDRGPGSPRLVVRGWTGTTWSPDGTKLAVRRWERSPETHMKGTSWVAVVPVDGGEPRVILEERFTPDQKSCGAGASPLSWSPDGSWLLFVRGGITASTAADCNVLAVVATTGGSPVTVAETPRPAWAVWEPGRPVLAYVDGAGRMAWYQKRLKLGAPPWRTAPSPTPAGFSDRDPAWHPGGRYLAFTRSEARGPDGVGEPSPGQAVYWIDTHDPHPTEAAGSQGGFAPFWDKSGELYWFRPRELYARRGRILGDLDLKYDYYGQWDVEEVFDSWEP